MVGPGQHHEGGYRRRHPHDEDGDGEPGVPALGAPDEAGREASVPEPEDVVVVAPRAHSTTTTSPGKRRKAEARPIPSTSDS